MCAQKLGNWWDINNYGIYYFAISVPYESASRHDCVEGMGYGHRRTYQWIYSYCVSS